MKYKNKTIPLSKLILQKTGPIEPLCNSCKTKDCENLIERKSVSVLGVNKKWRLSSKLNQHLCVIECDGYST